MDGSATDKGVTVECSLFYNCVESPALLGVAKFYKDKGYVVFEHDFIDPNAPLGFVQMPYSYIAAGRGKKLLIKTLDNSERWSATVLHEYQGELQQHVHAAFKVDNIKTIGEEQKH